VSRSRWLSLQEAAERLGLSAGTLRLQAERGKLRATKVANRWLVTLAEVERYRREHRRPRDEG
jgi:excisionase family DNA binding protein